MTPTEFELPGLDEVLGIPHSAPGPVTLARSPNPDLFVPCISSRAMCLGMMINDIFHEQGLAQIGLAQAHLVTLAAGQGGNPNG